MPLAEPDEAAGELVARALVNRKGRRLPWAWKVLLGWTTWKPGSLPPEFGCARAAKSQMPGPLRERKGYRDIGGKEKVRESERKGKSRPEAGSFWNG